MSGWPSGHEMGSPAALMARRASKRASHVRQTYSYTGITGRLSGAEGRWLLDLSGHMGRFALMERTDVPNLAADTIVLPAEAASAARAREFVRDLVRRAGYEELEDAAVLCVTELVANVSVHTHSHECVVTVVPEPHDLLIQVADRDSDLPTVEPAGRLAEHGRGMRIIDALAGEWGVRRVSDEGKCIWLRLFCRR